MKIIFTLLWPYTNDVEKYAEKRSPCNCRLLKITAGNRLPFRFHYPPGISLRCKIFLNKPIKIGPLGPSFDAKINTAAFKGIICKKAEVM